jgi:hypothetical protein
VPVELILLPRWFPIHLSKMSYWARTVIVPLLVLQALKPLARNPRGVTCAELFVPRAPPSRSARRIRTRYWAAFFGARLVLKLVDADWPKGLRKRAIDAASLRHRAAERRGRLGRDLSRHGQQRDDVRCAGLPESDPRSRDCAALGREAARDQGRRSLLPALRVAGVGYGACLPRADGSERRSERRVRSRAGSNGSRRFRFSM